MTLQKLAKLAGVSVSTVSKAFCESSEISEETKKLIFETAKEEGVFEKYYKPVYSRKVIAVICPELLGMHYSQMVTHIEKTVSLHEDTLLISIANFSSENQEKLLEYYINYLKVDGIIVIEPAKQIKRITKIPIVQISMDDVSSSVHCVNMNVGDALDNAFNYLKENGHTEIGYIGEKYTLNEFDIFKTAAERNGITLNEEYIDINDRRFYDCGYYGTEKMLKNMPSVIFAAYSHIAIGIIKKLNEENIKIPEDISVICMDDIDSIPYSNIKLSCIKLHLDVLCEEAVSLLYRCFENNYLDTTQLITVNRVFEKGETIGKN